MKKFFEGKLSLPISFWVFGFIGSAIMGFIGVLITQDILMMRVVFIKNIKDINMNSII